MENKNQITVDAKDDEMHKRIDSDQGAAHDLDNKSENVADANDKSDVIDVIGNGQLIKKVNFNLPHEHSVLTVCIQLNLWTVFVEFFRCCVKVTKVNSHIAVTFVK